LLILPVVPACGGSGSEETPITTATSTATPTITATPIATPSAGPVKIGGINAWSGPAALSGALSDPVQKLVEWQVKQSGGILGGREVKIVHYDNRAMVAEAAAGAKKLILEDKVSALIWGGTSGAEMDAISDVAEANNVLYVTMGEFANKEAKCTISATYAETAWVKPAFDLATKILNAKTLAFLGPDLSDGRRRYGYYEAGFESTDIKWVYKDFTPPGTTDLSPYLTKIKYANPDLLFLDGGQNDFIITAAKQIIELGGWENIKVITLPTGEQAAKLAGADGWYVMSVWVPDVPNAASQKFVEDYQTVNRAPVMSASQIYYYNSAIIAIKAIQMAGSDDQVKVLDFVKTGKLEVDTPMGLAKFTQESKGYGGLYPALTQIQNKKLVSVNVPQ